ncbi:MAG: glucose-6-phosphate dehydrogenase [Gemmatimonadaceae bacterium]
MIICGALGDLSRRKLMPAIYRLAVDGLLPASFRVLGAAREDHDDATFRAAMREAVIGSEEAGAFDLDVWTGLSDRLFYQRADLTDPAGYTAVAERLAALEAPLERKLANRLFYLAVPPVIFESIVRNLSSSGLAPKLEDPALRPWRRVVIEKPFGTSLATAQALNTFVLGVLAEPQLYRIDHYLGKDTVQNLIVFRFANSIFEPLWNRGHVAQVQITVAETVGVETRGKYYEGAGVLRDMFQNHLLQLLALTAMEPPVTMSADAVRDEKVKVLRSIRWLTPQTIPGAAVRAQYKAGENGGAGVAGYRDEPDVAAGSTMPTYAALRLSLDSWRWKDVPFYLRSGKRLAKRVSEIAVQFRAPPLLMFGHKTRQRMEPNTLVIRVQPNEGMSLSFEVKRPGAKCALTPEIEVSGVDMDFGYERTFGASVSPAYETLLLDVMLGEQTLFTRSDEVEAAWRVVDPLIAYWESHARARIPTYAAGSWGPREADALLEADGVQWRTP